MESTHIVIKLLCINLSFQQAIAFRNITYHSDKKSWKEAARFCSLKGGILESTFEDIKYHVNFDDVDDDVWLGKYKSITPWKAIWGCFQIDSYCSSYPINSTTDYPMCQKLCGEFEFFSIKGIKCICISRQLMPENKEKFVPCNCRNCFQVMKQHILTSNNENGNNCLAVICDNNGIVSYKPGACTQNYLLICDNDVDFGYLYTQGQQAEACNNSTSFIKWYQNCPEIKESLHWTSATRSLEPLILIERDNDEEITPEECQKGEKDGGLFKTVYTIECGEELSFFCRFSGGDQESSTIMDCQTANNMKMEEEPNYSGAIIAVVLLIIVVAAVVAAVIIYRRRLASKSPKSSHLCGTDNYTTHNQPSNYPRDSVVLSPNYSLPNPLIMDGQLSDDYDYSTGIPDVNNKINESERQKQKPGNTYDTTKNLMHADNNYNEIDITDVSKVSGGNGSRFENEENTDYSFAVPINEEDNDPYTTNKDYDRLHNVKKKGNLNHKVYDHLPATKESDPTYDHTNLNIATTSDGDYDHFSAKS